MHHTLLPRSLIRVAYAILVGLLCYSSLAPARAQVIAPDIEIVKTGPPSASPGGIIIYTLSYRNNSSTLTATGVTITDVVPNNTVFHAAGSDAGWSCADGDPQGTSCQFTLGDLAPGASGTVTIAVRVNSALPAGVNQISNTAEIVDDLSQGADPVPGNNVSNRTTPVVGLTPTPTVSPTATILPATGPDLQVVKIDSGPATPGGLITYRLTYSNLGPGQSTGVALTERVPNNTVFVAGQSTTGWSCPDGSPELTTCTFPIGTLAQGASNTIIFAVRVVTQLPAGVNEIANTVTIADDGTSGVDPVAGNGTSAVITPLVIATATATRTPAPKIIPTNPPPATATAQATATAPAQPPAQATSTPEGWQATPEATAVPATPTGTLQVADPAVTKAANPTEARVGDQVEFTITVNNPGNTTAEGVVVTDDIAAFLDLISVNATRGEVHTFERTVQVRIGSLAPGEVVTITIQTRVNSMAEPPGNRNVAIVSGSDTNPNDNTDNNTSSVEVRVLPPENNNNNNNNNSGANNGSGQGASRPQPRKLPVAAADEDIYILGVSRNETLAVAAILLADIFIIGMLFRRRKLRLRR